MDHVGKTVQRLSAKTTEPLTISVPEAGRRLGIGRNAAYDAARRGELPVLRLGRRLVVPLAALDRKLGG
jgi:excisionase family DNA binding protein